MKIFTIASGSVKSGAMVTTRPVAGTKVPVIEIGQDGRGRSLGTMLVVLPPSLLAEWQEKGSVTVFAGKVGKTGDKYVLKVEDESSSEDGERILCVMPTKMGFRGGNSHTGDRVGEEEYQEFGETKTRLVFEPFPGEILVEGHIAEGDAGAMGGGRQLISLIPKDVWFRTGYSGRLYGAPNAHYYRWDGKSLVVMTWEERKIAEAVNASEEEIQWL